MFTAKAILEAAKARIADPAKWTNDGHVWDGQDCAGTALDRETKRLSPDGKVVSHPEYKQACACFHKAIGQERVITWNDARDRTHADVMAAFDKAIGYAEQSA